MDRTEHMMRIRLPADLRERVEAEAKASGRSMNAEIIIRLRERYGGTNLAQRLDDIRADTDHMGNWKAEVVKESSDLRTVFERAEHAAQQLSAMMARLEEHGLLPRQSERHIEGVKEVWDEVVAPVLEPRPAKR